MLEHLDLISFDSNMDIGIAGCMQSLGFELIIYSSHVLLIQFSICVHSLAMSSTAHVGFSGF